MPKICPKCSHDHNVKSGFVRGRQRYLCKKCHYNWTVVEKNAKMATNEIKKLALQMYLGGLGFRSIGRILDFSHVAVYNWIKAFGEQIEKIHNDSNIEIIEIDEMHSYIGSKKNLAGHGLLLIDINTNLSMLSLASTAQKQVKNVDKE